MDRTLGLFLRWVFSEVGPRRANRLAFSLLHRAERRLDTNVSIHSASWISKCVMSNLDWSTAARQRRINFEIVRRGIAERGLPVKPLYDHLETGVTPLGFPVITEDRDGLRAFLIQKKIYPPIHWLLPEDAALYQFVHLIEMSHHILTLPIDQRYGVREMNYILDCITEWSSSL